MELNPPRLVLLERLTALLQTTAADAGMVSERDRDRILERHVVDCLRAATVVRPEDREALDLGSGAGLPGVVVAIAVPGLHITLVESRRRRVAFLEQVVEVLELPNVSTAHTRIQDLRVQVDLCFARALAPLGRTWHLAAPLLRSGGRLVYFAGEGSAVELEAGDVATVSLLRSPVLESSGPLVIMSRQ
ncbi:MAG TPA: 16S rRNA (guanine(527)-N(7))-methyltransferase RsmG [Actinomycetota bacterium]